MNLSVLYRGALSSCNYGCDYCPFAKHVESREEHEHDNIALMRFVDRVTELSGHQFEIFFTPWGEALIHKRYQNAVARLSRAAHVGKVAIQTNLSCDLKWLDDCNKSKVGLWCTYHPTEIARAKFLDKCHELVERDVRFSVGVVGLKEHFAEIVFLRNELPESVYMWINAFKRTAQYYESSDLRLLESIDPLFSINNQYHSSLGRDCRCGSSVFSVDQNGDMRRCHFIKDVIGNFYDEFESELVASPCTNQVCGCHIGYVHMNDLKLYEVFGNGVLERIPEAMPAMRSRISSVRASRNRS